MRYLLTLLLFLSTFSQGVNDKNFKEKINGGGHRCISHQINKNKI